MMRVMIADDEAPAREKLEHWLAEQPDVTVVGSVKDGLSAAQCIEQRRPQVAFLDVQMPTLSGLQVAAQLDPSSAPLIVFVTAFDQHALKAFDLNAVDYLLKPYDRERFARTVQRVRERLQSYQPGARAVAMGRAQWPASERLLVPDGERLRLIETASIEWLQADDNYVHVHTAGSRYLLRRTLHDLLFQLGEQRFMRIHRSTAVNIGCIAALAPLFKGDYEVHLHNGRVLRLSRRYRDMLFARMVW
ncbi:MAG TPA: LytTR family DNA-binding domain-containing protein [Dyella sp.]|uniref:LytR/AlgR family response regulator transcription factor n=1 Tax=Dyella sp. TaxID=1869338 RepID=UPI002CDA8186|nr:LytTR family DNA-binding domain-containing protein [Dyella sp.]HTV85017.1 LytTR family DNA-binding domain-containing protein [Dyella sp.]